MPGIAGIFSSESPPHQMRMRLKSMVGCMLHEPSYRWGTYPVPEAGCYVGWVTHENSFSDCNPAVSAAGDLILIFSGEHLGDDDEPETGRKTATSVLKLFERKGEQCLSDLNGWFAGVLIDRRRRTALLFNDRFGVNRIYYHEHEGTFAFSSEAKSLLATCPETRSLDAAGLSQFLAYGTTFENRTLFANISVVPGGSAWRYRPGSVVSRRRYFDVTVWENQPVLPKPAVLPALASTVARVFPKHFSPAAGISLTGGLDTRILLAGRPCTSAPASCYTYRGVYRDCLDVEIARNVAAQCGLRHHVIRLDDDFFRNFSSYAEQTVWITDGCLDVCGSHEIYYSRRAREIAPIRVTGNYGSEILRGVTTFKYLQPPDDLFHVDVRPCIREAVESFAQLRRGHPVTFSAFKDIPWHLFGRLAAARSQLEVRSPYMDNDLIALVYRTPAEWRRSNQLSLRLISALDPRLAAIATDMGYGGMEPAISSGMKRVYRYLQFKAEWYYNAGMPQWLVPFDRAIVSNFEPLFLGSHKIEHYRVWFRDELFKYVQDMLRDRSTASRPYLNRRFYDALVAAHGRRTRNYLNEIANILTLELIQRLLLERRWSRVESTDAELQQSGAHGSANR